MKKLFNLRSASFAVRDSVWLTCEKLISMAVVLIVNIFLARYLGPTGFGELAFLIAVVVLAEPLSSLGMNGILVRELINRPEDEAKILNTSLFFRTVSGVLLWISLLIFFSVFGDAEAERLKWIMLFGISVCLNGLLTSQFWFQAKVRSRILARSRIVLLLVFSILKILAVVYNLEVSFIYSVFVLELIAIPIVVYSTYRCSTSVGFSLVPDIRYGLVLLRSSSWLILSGIASIIYLKIDLLMLAQMTSMEETGLYAIASRLSEVWYFVPTAIVTAFFPALLQHRRTSVAAYHQHLEFFYSILFWMAVVIALSVTLFASPVIQLLYGEKFAGAAVILVIHVWAGIFIFMRALFSKWLIAEDILQFSLITHGLGAVVNVLLNFLLIPTYQAEGAAWATVISYATASFFALFCNPRTFGSAVMMMKAPYYPIRLLLKRSVQ